VWTAIWRPAPPGYSKEVVLMKSLAMLASAVLALATTAGAAQMPPAPIPDAVMVVDSAPIELYCNVRYKDLRNIHPCAVEKIVAVPDPCPDPCACGPQCVYVKVCVPPCDCYETKCRRNGKKIIMDFGKYKVEITSIRGQVIVDYDD
jgi:hypothetical protein